MQTILITDPPSRRWLLSLAILACSSTLQAENTYSFDNAQAFLTTYCKACHQGNSPAGGFALQRVATAASLRDEAQRWASLTARINRGEMPPKGAPAPAVDQREQFVHWVDGALRAEACASGIVPGPALIRRLNRDEYTATLRDLLDMHLDVGHALPADGAGGEGFDNAIRSVYR